MLEKRETIRLPVNSRTAYCDPLELIPRTGKLINVSRGGACLQTHKAYKPNDRLTLTVPLQERDESLTITGTVRWVENGGLPAHHPRVGVEWLPLDGLAETKLNELFKEPEQRAASQKRGAPQRPAWRLPIPVFPSDAGDVLHWVALLLTAALVHQVYFGLRGSQAVLQTDPLGPRQQSLAQEVFRVRRDLVLAAQDIRLLQGAAVEAESRLIELDGRLDEVRAGSFELGGERAAFQDNLLVLEQGEASLDQNAEILRGLLQE